MRLRTRLAGGILVASLVPLVLLGVAATQQATRAITARVVELHLQKADNLATYVDTYLSARLDGLELVRRTFSPSRLGDRERVGLERLVYQQYPDVNLVCLLGPGGEDLAPSQYVPPGSPLPPGHEAVSPARFRAFREALPVSAALSSGFAIGPPYLPPDAAFPVVPVAVALGAGDVVLGVELSLGRVVAQLESQVVGGMEIALLDERGAFVLRRGAGLVRPQAFAAFLGGTSQADLRYELEDGTRVLATFCRVPSTGWLAVVAEPYDAVTAPGREIRLRTAYFGLVASVLALVLGYFFSRQIHRPIAELRDAAVAIGRGELGRTVEPDSTLELGELGRAFNEMSRRLKENREEIEAQRREIEAFNRELQQRVEERTRELREAQARLVESGKLAAVAELGAGLAHELNNPLAGVLGLAQILRARLGDSPHAPLLASLEEQAQRCSLILRRLHSITEDSAGPGEREEVELGELFAEVVSLVGSTFRSRSVELAYEPPGEPLLVRADRPRLARALTQLLTSLRARVAEGGRLELAGERRDGELRFTFSIHPERKASGGERDDWFASGMSLWVARRILAEHGGRLEELREGGLFVLVLPEVR